MDLMVHPKTLAVGPDPLSPNIPTGKAKALAQRERAMEGAE
jgi:hypothetical protein